MISTIMGRNFVGGLVAGKNFSTDINHSIINLKDCDEILIVDRNYLLENLDFILAWAKKETL